MAKRKRKGGHCRSITKEQRDGILDLVIQGREAEAQTIATSLGLNRDYAYRLGRERGVVPFRQKGHLYREIERTM